MCAMHVLASIHHNLAAASPLPDTVSHLLLVLTAEVSRAIGAPATRALPITPRSHSPAARHVQTKTVSADELHSEQPQGRIVGADSTPTSQTATKVLQSRTFNAATAEKMQSAQANKPAVKGLQQKHTSHATAMNASPRQAGRSSPTLSASPTHKQLGILLAVQLTTLMS